MTKEQRKKILGALAEERNEYARECLKRIEREHGKIEGADYMFQRFLDVVNAEVCSESDRYNQDLAKLQECKRQIEDESYFEQCKEVENE